MPPDDQVMPSNASEAVSSSVGSQVQRIVAQAEQAALEIRRDVESETNRRASELRAGAEADADRILRDAEARATHYMSECQARIDAFTEDRIGRLTELTDGLIEQAESLQSRFEGVETVKRQLYDLVAALGQTAEAVAREAAGPGVSLPAPPGLDPAEDGPLPSRARREAPVIAAEQRASDPDAP